MAFEVKEKPKMVERALLVSVYQGGTQEKAEAESLLKELEDLVDTLGIPVFERMVIQIRQPNARLLLGSGKAEEIIKIVQEKKLDVIIFDNELTPGQQRNWESLSKVCVIDRQEVILDIFANRAHTKEARLQVELARMEYSLPRLTRAWTHFGQQRGGTGVRGGEGESQLELDKRMVRKQIDRLKRDLETVKKRRATMRKERQRVPFPMAAIVGYTNAGKSSLLHRLTGAEVLVEDKLFATLDPTTRKIILPNNQPILLTDTVGFVRKLPHGLVEAFNATLEEAVLANYLIHLVDASHPHVTEFYNTTMRVLADLNADQKRTVTVFNKIDRVDHAEDLRLMKSTFPDAVFISAKTGQGIDDLMDRLEDLLVDQLAPIELMVPHHRSDVVASLHREGKVTHLEYLDEHVKVAAVLAHRQAGRYRDFLSSTEEESSSHKNGSA